jgi:hypothetical protein
VDDDDDSTRTGPMSYAAWSYHSTLCSFAPAGTCHRFLDFVVAGTPRCRFQASVSWKRHGHCEALLVCMQQPTLCSFKDSRVLKQEAGGPSTWGFLDPTMTAPKYMSSLYPMRACVGCALTEHAVSPSCRAAIYFSLFSFHEDAAHPNKQKSRALEHSPHRFFSN